MENYYDVAVVGGGQVGLMTACELAIQSVKVVVLERRLNRIRNSRALTLHPRSLELMAMRGIENRFYLEVRNQIQAFCCLRYKIKL